MPALESLKITGLSQPAGLGAFVQRSQCALTSLVIRRSSMRIADLLRIFDAQPNLKHFAMEEGITPTAITGRLLEALIVNAARPALLPNLTTLSIDGSYMFRDSVLLQMLESRTPAAELSSNLCASLDLVKLSIGNRMVKDEDVERSRALQGVEVSLYCLDREGELVEVIY
ncbi:hypothetical protein B0H14DRAFT_2922466 [Mycena olivaceomarginata]|nr:hypothetical protein B0H14DRAFT_2922466 [Mycena olivaceomarginata]